jgi:glycosyltransferase involved in cell wall biosynthesis
MGIENMDTNNILIVSPEFPPLTNWGGIATFSENLARVLAELNRDVYVLTYDRLAKELRYVDKPRYTVIYIPLKTKYKLINFFYYRFPLGPVRNIVKLISPEFCFIIDWNVFSLLAFIILNRKLKFTEIHSHSYQLTSLLINLFFRGIPCFCYAGGPQFILSMYESPSFGKKIIGGLESYYMSVFPKKIIACSKSIKNKITKYNPSLKPKTVSIPNFIEVKKYMNNKKINRNKIVYWSRLDYRKGVDLLIKAFVNIARKNSNITLTLVGDKYGDFIVRGKRVNFDLFYNSLIINKDIKERILIIPNISYRSKLIHFLENQKGIAVFPSRYEPFGIVNIEAMALGFLVVSSNSGGGKEIIDNLKTGFLVKPNIFSLTKAINTALNLNNKKISKITRSAQKEVRTKFDISNFNNIYSKLVNQQAS